VRNEPDGKEVVIETLSEFVSVSILSDSPLDATVSVLEAGVGAPEEVAETEISVELGRVRILQTNKFQKRFFRKLVKGPGCSLKHPDGIRVVSTFFHSEK